MRLVLRNAGFRQLLHDPKLIEDMRRRAERIQEAAGDGFELEADHDAARARFRVWSATYEARRAEASSGALTRAIDAGR